HDSSQVVNNPLHLIAPPTPTHSPYTTLFRSRQQRVVPPPRAPSACRRDGRPPRPRLRRRRRGPRDHQAHVRYSHRGDRARSARVDRKSTRLNSSHVKISYAAFCLKTKTTS